MKTFLFFNLLSIMLLYFCQDYLNPCQIQAIGLYYGLAEHFSFFSNVKPLLTHSQSH